MRESCTSNKSQCKVIRKEESIPQRDGWCLFHSKDERLNQGFAVLFTDYLLKQDSEVTTTLVIDEFVFKSDEDVLSLSEIAMYRPVKFHKCTFTKKLSLLDSDFKYGLSFEDCTFREGATIKGGSYGSMAFQNVTFEKQLRIQNIGIVTSYFIFQSITLGGGIYLENTTISKMCSISDCTISMKSMRDISYVRNVIFDELTMENNVSTAQVIFDNITFTKSSMISNNRFHTPATDYNTFDNILKFSNISVPNDSTRLTFRGSSDFKFTEVDTYVSFLGMNGFVEFDYFDFTYLSQVAKSKIFELEKEGRAIITNSTKYRHRTDAIEVPLTDRHQHLAEELSRTFTHYFNHSQAYDIGVEVISKGKSSIKLYYYTNESITREHFLERLGMSAQGMWDLVTSTSADTKELAAQTVYETKVNLTSFLLKLGPKVSQNDISDKELESLFDVLGGAGYGQIQTETLKASAKSDSTSIVLNFVNRNELHLHQNTFIDKVEYMDNTEIEALLNQRYVQLSKEIKAVQKPILAAIAERTAEEKKLLLQLEGVLQSNLLDENILSEIHSKMDNAISKIDLKQMLETEKELLKQYSNTKSSNVDLKEKVKFTLPIIPLFLKYETETSINIKAWYKEMIEDFKNGDIFIKK